MLSAARNDTAFFPDEAEKEKMKKKER